MRELSGSEHYDVNPDDEILDQINDRERLEIEQIEGTVEDIANFKAYFSSAEFLELVDGVKKDEEAAKQALVDTFEPVIQKLINNKIITEIALIRHEGNIGFDRRPFEDLLTDVAQEGRVALLESARKYVTGKTRVRFYHYAYMDVLRKMLGFVYDELASTHMPGDTGDQMRKGQEERADENYHHEWVVGPVAAKRQVFSPRWFYLVEGLFNQISMEDGTVREDVDQAVHNDQPLDSYGSVVEKEALEKVRDGSVWRSLDVLRPRQRAVIERRFGLNGGDPMSREEVAEEFGYTKGGIGNIETAALKKMRDYLYKFDR
jgi:RNA polymerase primary sigma factor